VVYTCAGEKAYKFEEILPIFKAVSSNPDNNPGTLAEFHEAFKTFDREGQGYINAAELRHVLKSLGSIQYTPLPRTGCQSTGTTFWTYIVLHRVFKKLSIYSLVFYSSKKLEPIFLTFGTPYRRIVLSTKSMRHFPPHMYLPYFVIYLNSRKRRAFTSLSSIINMPFN